MLSLITEDQRLLDVGRMRRPSATPEELSSTWVCKSPLEGQAPVTRLLGWPPSCECNGPSLGWLIPVTPCIGLCAGTHGWFQSNPEILFKKQKPWRMTQWWTALGIWKWNRCGMILLLPKLVVLWRTQEMVGVLLRAGMWRSKGWRERNQGRTIRKPGADWLFLSVDYSIMKEHIHWWKIGKPHKEKKKNYHPFVT